MKNHEDLALLLLKHLAAHQLDSQEIIPALQELTESTEEPLILTELLEVLRDVQLPAVKRLRSDLVKRRLNDAFDFYNKRTYMTAVDIQSWPSLHGLPVPPPGWYREEGLLAQTRILASLLSGYYFLDSCPLELPSITAVVKEELQQATSEFRDYPGRWTALLPGLEDAPQWLDKAVSDAKSRVKNALTGIFSTAGAPGGEPDEPASLLDLVAGALEKFDEEDLVLETVFEHCGTDEDDRTGQRELLDTLLQWPTDRVAATLEEYCREPWAREYASVLLMMRFGKSYFKTWPEWKTWLQKQANERRQRHETFKNLTVNRRAELCLLWYEEQENRDPQLYEQLKEQVRKSAASLGAQEFIDRWHDHLSPAEHRALLRLAQSPGLAALETTLKEDVPVGETPPVVGSPPTVPAEEEVSVTLVKEPDSELAQPDSESAQQPAAVKAPPPTTVPIIASVRREPSFWNETVTPFLFEYWYMVAGLAMVVVGASLLAYFTWDKHWILRYTIMPTLLAAFTIALGQTGTWLGKRFPFMRTTGIMLQGAAIGLVPLNFMVLTLLTRDQTVPGKTLVVPLMTVLLLGVFGAALRSWCRSVHAHLATIQGATLLVLNILICLVPLSLITVHGSTSGMNWLLGAGFYSGFVLAAISVWLFLKRLLTPELLKDRVVLWFFGLTVTGTFLEVFALVHWTLGHVPRAVNYSIMTILTGGLVIVAERYLAGSGTRESRYGGESFLGYAFIFLGILLGMASPSVRIASFFTAGTVWLYQASMRRSGAQYGIGHCLLMLGGVCIGLLESFPKSTGLNALPLLGLGMALGFRLLQEAAYRLKNELLWKSARDFLPGILLITVLVSVVSQILLRSNPLSIGSVLVLIGLVLGWKAEKEQRRGWIYGAVSLLALALPYLGCADMLGLHLYPNTMVFGLSVLCLLWLAFLKIHGKDFWLQTRSSVLFGLGILALFSMLVRVGLEQSVSADYFLREWMDVLGPLVMTAVLLAAAYYSRSLLPAVVAVLITVVLLPELKTFLTQAFPFLHWGSGFGSSLWALAVVLVCFPLRTWRKLADLPEGDRWFDGTPFPFTRRDHTLFTWPLAATTLFLLAKVDIHNFGRAVLVWGNVPVKTALALGVTSITWLLLAAYFRSRRFGWAAVQFSWITLLFSSWFLCVKVFHCTRNQVPFLVTGLIIQGLGLALMALRARFSWMEETLIHPLNGTVKHGAWIVSIGVMFSLLVGAPVTSIALLGLFLYAELIWYSLKSRSYLHGTAAVALGVTTLIAWRCPGTDFLPLRMTCWHTLTPVLLFSLAVYLLRFILEWLDTRYERVKPLLLPHVLGSTMCTLAAAGYAAFHMLFYHPIGLTLPQRVLVLTTVALAARIFRSGALGALLLFMSYLFVLIRPLGFISDPFLRTAFLTAPWNLAFFSLILAAVGQTGEIVTQRWPAVLASRKPLGGKSVLPTQAYLFVPAVLMACFATLRYWVTPVLFSQKIMLLVPYLAALTMLLVGISWKRIFLAVMAVLTLCLANSQLVFLYLGDTLLLYGLSRVHLICLGLVLTLLQGTVVQLLLIRNRTVKRFVSRGSSFLASAILMLLTMFYFAHSNLELVTAQRFAISGLMALAAGIYLRRAARRPQDNEQALVPFFEGMYHFGLTITIWCFALIFPWFRNPNTALIAFTLVPVFFYLNAEYRTRHSNREIQDTAVHFRNSAVLIGSVILGLYVFRTMFQMIFFPLQPVLTAHFHFNAPVVILMGLMFIRLHALGSSSLTALYGGLAMATGAYFGITAYPGLSPFDYPVAAAWTGIVLVHFIVLSMIRRSPIRTILQEIGQMDGPTWQSLRSVWGHVLIWAVHIVILVALTRWNLNTYIFAPLLIGAASLFAHQGSVSSTRFYLGLAGLLAAVAVHADFLMPSYLGRLDVIWVILGLWAALLAGTRLINRWIPVQVPDRCHLLLCMVAFFHILYHRPWNLSALAAMAISGVLLALVPREDRWPDSTGQRWTAGILLTWIPWMAYFGQVYFSGKGADGMFDTWPVLVLAGTLLIMGSLARLIWKYAGGDAKQDEPARARLMHQTLTLVTQYGDDIHRALLTVVTFICVVVLNNRYGTLFASREMVAFVLLWGGAALAWFIDGRDTSSTWKFTVGQLCAFGLLVLIRHQVMVSSGLWNHEYDIWASLLISTALAGSRPWTIRQDRAIQKSLEGTLLLLPLLTLAWAVGHQVSTDIVLVTIGLNSLLFSFLGRGDRQSRYSVLAIWGWVVFILVLFWQKLELRALHAYVIPTGLGVLAMLQIFGKELEKETRNQIRMVVLLAMLGSAGYYALADNRYPIMFNLTMLLLGLASMVLGSILRVRLYLVLGCTGILVDLASIVYKIVIQLQRTYQMTIIGSLLLVLGLSVVAGSVYYKTHREEIEKRLQCLREWFGTYE